MGVFEEGQHLTLVDDVVVDGSFVGKECHREGGMG